MQTKFLEVRDTGTCVPCLAIRFSSSENKFFRAAGYAGEYVLLVKLFPCDAECDPAEWDYSRTMLEAHRHIEANWDSLVDGQVVDVQYVLGETSAPKPNEI